MPICPQGCARRNPLSLELWFVPMHVAAQAPSGLHPLRFPFRFPSKPSQEAYPHKSAQIYGSVLCCGPIPLNKEEETNTVGVVVLFLKHEKKKNHNSWCYGPIQKKEHPVGV